MYQWVVFYLFLPPFIPLSLLPFPFLLHTACMRGVWALYEKVLDDDEAECLA